MSNTSEKVNELQNQVFGNLNQEPVVVTDFVIEEGMYHGWYYRKWNNGRFDAYITNLYKSAALSETSISGLYSNTDSGIDVTCPDIGITSFDYISVQDHEMFSDIVSTKCAWFESGLDGLKHLEIGFYALSSSVNANLSIHISGTYYKE